MTSRKVSSDPWAAEIEVGEAQAAELIGRQFPNLGSLRLKHVGEGWTTSRFP